MKEKYEKWLPVLAPACFVIAVFMIADGHFWTGKMGFRMEYSIPLKEE